MSESPRGGLLLIPDISGFTKFVNTVEISHGQHITGELLEALMEETELGMELSEIEGDALLEYRMGPPPTFPDLMAHVKACFGNFYSLIHRMQQEIYCDCGACQSIGGLSLKIVGHYGEIGIQKIGGHNKLFGPAVILVHRMLKNRIEWRDYALFSETLWGECRKDAAEISTGKWHFRTHGEDYPVFGNVAMQAADLEPLVKELPPPPPPEPPTALAYGFETHVEIAVPLTDVIEQLVNFEKWPLWVEGLKRSEWDATAPHRKGRVHKCVMDMGTVRLTLEEMNRGERDFLISNRFTPPTRFLTGLLSTFVARQEEGKVRLSALVSYDTRRGAGWLYRKFFEPGLRRAMGASLQNMKNLLEG